MLYCEGSVKLIKLKVNFWLIGYNSVSYNISEIYLLNMNCRSIK